MNWRRIKRIFKWLIGILFLVIVLVNALLLVFKDNIKNYAINEANQYLNKRVHVSSAAIHFWKSFPNLTLSFGDVLVYSRFDTLQTADTALYAEKLNLRLNPFDFYKGKYNIQEVDVQKAKVNLRVLEDGKVNYDFLKPPSDKKTSPFQFKLEDIIFTQTHFTYSNASTQQQYAGFFHKLRLNGVFSEKKFILKAKSKFEIENIQSQSVSLITNRSAQCNLVVQMDEVNQIFEIKSADVTINHLPFTVRGRVSSDSLNFYVGAHQLSLPAVANNFGFQQLNIIHKMKGTGKVNFDLSIRGKRNDNESSPAVNAAFSVKDGSLSKSGFHLSNINLAGKYTNEGKQEISLSELQFHTLNKDFNGQLTISDFEHPQLKGTAHGIVDLSAIHQLFNPFKLKKLAGNIDVNGQFDVRMNQPQGDPKNISIALLNAQFKLHQVKVQMQNDPREINLNTGEIDVLNQHAEIKDLFVTIGHSDIGMQGKIDHISDYLSGKSDLKLSADISSNNLFINDLAKKKAAKASERSWMLPERIQGEIRLGLQRVDYDGHEYSKINGRMEFGEHQLNFPQLEGINAAANISGSLLIDEKKPMVLTVTTQLASNNVYFKPLFEEWNNFQQQMIKAKNVNGKAKITLQLSGPFDLYEEKIIKDQFHVRAHIKISNGSLTNVEAFKAINKSLQSSAAHLVISKNKIADFQQQLLHLKFKTFENEFTIDNGVITIPEMTIHSNALDLNVYGTHSFTNKIDYHFDFRFRELKGNKQSEYGDIIDDGSGFRVFLRLYGSVAHPKFSWDKAAKKSATVNQQEQAKADFKSALKTGFGWGKQDTTIQTLAQPKKREDKVIMSFDEKDKSTPNQPKKEKKGLGKQLFKWKKEKKQEEKKKEPTFEINSGDNN